ncbi:MAG: archease [Acidobacteriota bacterium]
MGSDRHYEVIEHTGDVGIRLEASSLEVLFGAAAAALFDLLVEERPTGTPVLCVRIEGPDLEVLLVDWLNELLYLHTVGKWVLAPAHIRVESGFRLQAELVGEAFDPRRHRARREVKAATFHGLKVTREQERWRAQVIFDL